MKIYCVGGAVRDKILKLPISDRDWVVVGATPDDLIKLGFQQVGKNFPVFLHPKTREEYALARTEHKKGIGHTGFSCYFSPDVTIEEDLLRRDLTINAIAQTEDGKLIDPYHGERDIKNCLLRNVSDAFVEDPVRILRVARFAAYLAKKKFTITKETNALMQEIVKNHELSTISAERVWIETKKALQSPSPDIYFHVLHACGALAILFPEIYQLFNRPAKKISYHKDNTNTYTLLHLQKSALLTDSIEIRFAVLCYECSKTLLTLKQKLNDNNYTIKSISLIKNMCYRLRIPNKMKTLAILVTRFQLQIQQIDQLQPESIINLFNQLDSWRKPERIHQLAVALEANTGCQMEQKRNIYSQTQFLLKAFKISQQVSIKNLVAKDLKGISITEEITNKRIQALDYWIQKQNIY